MEEQGVFLGDLNRGKKKQRQLWWWGGFFSVLVVFFSISSMILMRAPFLRVEDIKISGTSQISEDNVRSLLYARAASDSWFDKVLGPSHMMAWPDSLKNEDLRFAPVIKAVSIEKNYSDGLLSVSVAERSPQGIWCLEKTEPPSCFWFDDEGILFKPAFSTEGNLIRVVRDYAHVSLGTGHSALAKELLPNLFSVLKVLEESDLSIKEVGLYDLSLEEVEVSTFSGPRILFSLRFIPEGASEVIESLRQKKNFNSLTYIDFRVEHRAYYK